MEINYSGVLKWMLIGIAMLVALGLITGHGHAANVSSVIVEDISEYSAKSLGVTEIPLDYIPRVEQGDKVYLNDTADITGVSGWPDSSGDYRIAYYGRWVSSFSPEDMDPEYIVKLPGKTRSGEFDSQYRYWINPAIFAERPGWWYQYTTNHSRFYTSEAAGNLRVFYVTGSYRTYTNTSGNTSMVYKAGNYTEKVQPVPAPLMPERPIADYLVAKGDSLSFYYPGVRIWVFGTGTSGIYDKRDYMLTVEDVEQLPAGSYTLVFHYPGNNTIHEISYVNDTLIPGLYGRQPVDVYGLSSSVVMDRFMAMLTESDDTIERHSLVVESPYITLDRIDETYVNGTVYDIRGYSNVANGTKITVTLDEGRSYKQYIGSRTVQTVAVRTSYGNLSYYRAYMPLDYDTLVAANALNHTVTARTALGGVVYKDFWISVLPPDSFKPNTTIKYTMDRNPFVPTPTPIVQKVVERQTYKVGETVVQTITPDASDYGKVAGGFVWLFAQIAGLIIVGGLALIGAGYLVSVWWRGRK